MSAGVIVLRIEKTEPVRFSANETFDLGMDTASSVSIEYQRPFRYAGTLKKWTSTSHRLA